MACFSEAIAQIQKFNMGSQTPLRGPSIEPQKVLKILGNFGKNVEKLSEFGLSYNKNYTTRDQKINLMSEEMMVFFILMYLFHSFVHHLQIIFYQRCYSHNRWYMF